MATFKELINLEKLPSHVAIIMDGNGRWAKKRGLERSKGHEAGAANAHVIAEVAAELGIKYLTLYTFSIENWSRPDKEVKFIMKLLSEQLLEEDIFVKNNIKFNVIGDFSLLDPDIMKSMNHCIQRTATNTGMCMTLALSYSSQWEITEAVRNIAEECKEGKLKVADIDKDCISQHLKTSYMPDPDLLIRTANEYRLSNCLLWQSAYSELYFCEKYWPDFDGEDFYKAIIDYQGRERRFGKTSEQIEI
ncbi:MAG: isoprenyl transferase [Bacteroidales bacterium]|nr:isoprenyl transferase [Bacteroidales bacterium]